MSNERWDSPFPYTIAFSLFKKHFTELNSIYWAHVPAASTIEKKAAEALNFQDDADPKSFFLISDENDKRMAQTYKDWKYFYREFSNYTRLNMLMLLSSCFETYLRTIISLSIESKPGVIIKSPNAVDGWFLLRKNREYGDYGSKEYQFEKEISSVCQGDWTSRIASYARYFGHIPLTEQEISELNDLRQKRNLVGHYFGRTRQKYEVPLYFEPTPVERVSHDKLIKYFSTVYNCAVKIDKHLHKDFVGSYDIIKYYYSHSKCQDNVNATPGDHAKELQKMLGGLGFPPVGTEYYRNITSYTFIENENDMCRYSRRTCITAIRQKLQNLNITLCEEKPWIVFSKYHFGLFSNVYSFRNNPEYCKKYTHKQGTGYFYSSKVIELIVSEIQANPATIISHLQTLNNQTVKEKV